MPEGVREWRASDRYRGFLRNRGNVTIDSAGLSLKVSDRGRRGLEFVTDD